MNKIKITTNETIRKEVELTLPAFFKKAETYTQPTYYAFFSENCGLCVTKGFTYECKPSGSIDWHKLTPCEKSEIDTLFIENQKEHKRMMFGVPEVSLDDNLPTEGN